MAYEKSKMKTTKRKSPSTRKSSRSWSEKTPILASIENPGPGVITERYFADHASAKKWAKSQLELYTASIGADDYPEETEAYVVKQGFKGLWKEPDNIESPIKMVPGDDEWYIESGKKQGEWVPIK